MRVCDEHVDNVSLHTYIHSYIDKSMMSHSNFLVDIVISVGLASAHPNFMCMHVHVINHCYFNIGDWGD